MKIEESHSNKLKKFYDEKYEKGYMNDNRYRIWSDTGIQLLRVKEPLKYISIEPRKILDYGCGQGAWINLLSKMFPKAKIFGIDISDTAISKAKIQFPDCQFMTFNGTKALFSNEFFDAIYSYHVLEHVNDLKASTTDIARMLKKGGYACIILPCANKNSLKKN